MPRKIVRDNFTEEITRHGFTWVNIKRPGKKQLEKIQKKYGFLDIDMKDCLPPLQRPKLVARDGYLFMVLLFPVFNRLTRKIDSAEIDFFISKNFLVTIHTDKLVPMKELLEQCKRQKKMHRFFDNPANLLVEMLTRLLKYCYPMIVHIGQDIDSIEDHVFEVHDASVTAESLRIKMNIVEFKSNTDLHEGVIRKLIKKSGKMFAKQKLDAYLEDLVEHAKEIKAVLENYSNTINALNETHQSLINLRANSIMKNLQLFAVIVFPLTLLAAIFGMNTLGGMPFMNHPFGFWLILWIMLAGTFSMLVIFKIKKLL